MSASGTPSWCRLPRCARLRSIGPTPQVWPPFRSLPAGVVMSACEAPLLAATCFSGAKAG